MSCVKRSHVNRGYLNIIPTRCAVSMKISGKISKLFFLVCPSLGNSWDATVALKLIYTNRFIDRLDGSIAWANVHVIISLLMSICCCSAGWKLAWLKKSPALPQIFITRPNVRPFTHLFSQMTASEFSTTSRTPRWSKLQFHLEFILQ